VSRVSETSIPLSFPGEGAHVNLGSRPSACATYGHERCGGPGEMEYGTIGCGSCSARSLDNWGTVEQRLVGWRTIEPHSRQPDAPSIFHQLQSRQRLVSDVLPDHNYELESPKRRPVDCTRRRRHRKSFPPGTPTSKRFRNSLWQRSATQLDTLLFVEPQVATGVSLSKEVKSVILLSSQDERPHSETRTIRT
jgi:hypothetical protein